MSSISRNRLGRTLSVIFVTAAILSVSAGGVMAEMWGVKTSSPFSEPPSTLFRFDADGQSFTEVGQISLDGQPVDVDGLAIDAFQRLYGFVPGDASGLLISIDPSTALATGIGIISGREIRGASFTETGELIGIDIFSSSLVEVDPVTGAQLGEAVPLTLDEEPFAVAAGTDLAIHADGAAVISSGSVDIYTVDLETGILTLLLADREVTDDGVAPHGSGLAFPADPTDDRLFLYDVNGDDEILAYDLTPPFTRELIYPDIVPGYNAGRGDLASFPGDFLTGVYDDTPGHGPNIGLTSFPNPFNPRMTLSFTLPEEQVVQVAVHDLAGRHVRTLHQGTLPAGEQRLTWEGTDATGRAMSAGIYLVRVTGVSWERARKVLLLP